MANVFLINSRNRRSIRTVTESKPKRSDHSSSLDNMSCSCKKHPKHRQSPGVCSLCLNESLSKLSLDFYESSPSMTSSSSSRNVDKTVSDSSSSESESESESEYSISSYQSSVSSCLSPLQHRYSEIVAHSHKQKKKHPKKQKNFLSRLFL